MIRFALILTVIWGVVMSEAEAARNVIDVASTGAVANDGKDDTAALRKAIALCRKRPGSVLRFAKGRYDFSAEPPGGAKPRHKSMNFRGCRDLLVDGGGATLMFDGVIGVMSFADCHNVVVRNLTIDWKRQPFSTGMVVATAAKSFDVKVFEEFPVVGGEPVGAFMEYDPKTGWPRRRCVDVYSGVTSTELVGPQLLRVHTKAPSRANVGALSVLRHTVYGPGGLSFNGCSNVLVENITIHTVPGMGITGGDTRDIVVRGLKIIPRPGTRGLMTATADAIHFNGCSGTIVIEDCTFQGMGDDAVNVHGMFHRVTERVDDRTVTTVVRNDWLRPPQPGHRIEFTDNKTLLPYATGVVASAEVDRKAKTHRITFAKPLPKELAVGHILGNVDWAPKLRIRNCKVIGNRARGFLIQTRDVIIENNSFRYNQASGINVTTDYDHWTESIGTRKIVIRNNIFEDNNNGANWHSGIISIFADVKGGEASPGVHQDILIEKNTFRNSDGGAVFVDAADGVVIRDNTIENVCRDPSRTGRKAIVFVQNSRNVTISGNKLVGPKSEKMEKSVMIGKGCEEDTIEVRDNEGF